MSIFRDLWATVVTAAGLAAGLSVVQDWNWPILGGSVRWGIVAVAAVSLVACTSSGWATDTSRSWRRDPLTLAATALGSITLLHGIVGLVTGGEVYLVWMMAGTLLLWLVSTARHIWQGAAGRPAIA